MVWNSPLSVEMVVVEEEPGRPDPVWMGTDGPCGPLEGGAAASSTLVCVFVFGLPFLRGR